jgi:hypothetical protein
MPCSGRRPGALLPLVVVYRDQHANYDQRQYKRQSRRNHKPTPDEIKAINALIVDKRRDCADGKQMCDLCIKRAACAEKITGVGIPKGGNEANM